MLAAWKNPPSNGVMRQWLSTVLKNFARIKFRTDKRVLDREKAAAASEIMPSGQEIIEREEIRKILLNAVLSLKEPNRSAVFLRYYENLSAKEVAARSKVPLSTARSRIHRGLEQIREYLDNKYDRDPMQWRAALAPIVGEKIVGSSLWSGVLIMSSSTKIGLALGGIVLALMGAFWMLVSGGANLGGDLPSDSRLTFVNGDMGEKIIDADPKDTPPQGEEKIKAIAPAGEDYVPEIKGVVICEKTGKPVEGVFMVAMGVRKDGLFDYDESTDSDENGLFTFSSLKNKKYRITACHNDYDENYVLTKPGDLNVVVPLRVINRFSIYGTAYNDEGEAMPKVKVSFFEEGALKPEEQVETDQYGRYRVNNLEIGNWRIRACRPSRVSSVVDAVPHLDANDNLEVRYLTYESSRSFSEGVKQFTHENRVVELVDRDLEVNFGLFENAEMVTWTGKVQKKDETKLYYCSFTMKSCNGTFCREVYYQSDGSFKVNKVPMGSYRVKLTLLTGICPNYYDGGIVTFSKPGKIKKDIVLPCGSIRGKIEVDQGNVYRDRSISLVLNSDSKRFFTTYWGITGEFCFNFLPPGTYSIHSGSYLHGPLWDPVVLEEGQAITGIRISERKTGRLVLTLKDFPERAAGYEGSVFDPSGFFELIFFSYKSNRTVRLSPFFMAKTGYWKKSYFLETGPWRVSIKSKRIGEIHRDISIPQKESHYLVICGKDIELP